MDDDRHENRRRRALELWEEAQVLQLTGAVEQAIDLYTESLAVLPTAEAYTFRGWAYSFLGRIEEAIDECKKAIRTDPTFGNPYNDIGSYLMRLGRLDEAEAWLQQAKSAERYEPRHFPFMNLARLFAKQGQLARAIIELDGALEHCPGEVTCIAMRERLTGLLN